MKTHIIIEFHRLLKIIMKSGWLSDALSSLDPTISTLSIKSPSEDDPKSSALRISAMSDTGSLEFDFPTSSTLNDDGPIDSIQRVVNVDEKYSANHLTLALKALQSSFKTSLRINNEGILSLQMMVIDAHKKQSFIDIVVSEAITTRISKISNVSKQCRPQDSDELDD